MALVVKASNVSSPEMPLPTKKTTLDKIRNMEGTFTLSKGAFSPVSETSGRALGASSSYQSAMSGRARGSSSSSGAGVRFNTGSSSGEPVLQI